MCLLSRYAKGFEICIWVIQVPWIRSLHYPVLVPFLFWLGDEKRAPGGGGLFITNRRHSEDLFTCFGTFYSVLEIKGVWKCRVLHVSEFQIHKDTQPAKMIREVNF